MEDKFVRGPDGKPLLREVEYRLRAEASLYLIGNPRAQATLREAADEIERLRERIRELTNAT